VSHSEMFHAGNVALSALVAIAFLFSRPNTQNASSFAATFPTTEILGRASVIDGDTIEIQGERIRLNGIDAPESAQRCYDAMGPAYRCGTLAANALAHLLAASRPTRCQFVERDRYGRFVGKCYLADGSDVAAALVAMGMAMDWPLHSGGAYSQQQAAAKSKRLGLWSGNFQPPWEWRAERRSRLGAAN
jgi:endonuclease YncB( thermonuclease family)